VVDELASTADAEDDEEKTPVESPRGSRRRDRRRVPSQQAWNQLAWTKLAKVDRGILRGVLVVLAMVASAIFAADISIGGFNNRITQVERSLGALQLQYLELLVRTVNPPKGTP